MTRFKNPCLSGALLALMLPLLGCASPRRPFDPGLISHVVLITLEDPEDAGALQNDCEQMLSTIPNVTVYACGRHVDTGRNAAVDGAYTLGLLVCFEDMPNYKAYLEHPGHVALVEKWKPKFSNLKIYDVGNERISE